MPGQKPQRDLYESTLKPKKPRKLRIFGSSSVGYCAGVDESRSVKRKRSTLPRYSRDELYFPQSLWDSKRGASTPPAEARADSFSSCVSTLTREGSEEKTSFEVIKKQRREDSPDYSAQVDSDIKSAAVATLALLRGVPVDTGLHVVRRPRKPAKPVACALF